MRKRVKRKPVSEMNVVPYIDVMLVLLVIFMITAPLLTQGVQVDLPQADAKALDDMQIEPLIVSVDRAGDFYLSVGEDVDTPIDALTLMARTSAVLRRHPKTPVMVRADENVEYGSVITVMVLLQKAGAASVGLVTEIPE